MKNDSNNAAKQMIARYPDLKPYPKSAAENLRRELRAVFPQITFSVRYKSFSGGDEITVSYEDGPKVEEVEAIANKYAYDSSQCDAMTDYYDYRPTEFTRIFGGAKFVLIRRDMSDRVRADLYCKAVEIAPDLAAEKQRREEAAIAQRRLHRGALVVDYSAKALAIFTDEPSDVLVLERIKAKRNSSLTYQGRKVAGWIFPKYRQAQLAAVMSL